MSEDLVYSATAWDTNAQLIADCARLGYLKPSDVILDPTYGNGTWWRVWTCDGGSGHVLAMSRDKVPDWDFRSMGFDDQSFDAVAFDPPYVSVGGRSTTGLAGMHAAYGMDDAPLTPAAVQQQINAGLLECFRVVKKGGIVLVKCQSYVSSGKVWPGTFLTWEFATAMAGFRLEDHLIHVSGPRPQPEDRGPQKHSRRNQSDLLVLRRPKR